MSLLKLNLKILEFEFDAESVVINQETITLSDKSENGSANDSSSASYYDTKLKNLADENKRLNDELEAEARRTSKIKTKLENKYARLEKRKQHHLRNCKKSTLKITSQIFFI